MQGAAPPPVTDEPPYDVLIVGGGINGCGIARDLAGRGLRVLLCEQHDLAAHTSSASTKLIHGGLRYLEYGEFALVHKALAEREVLLRLAPHIIEPMRFVMPHDAGMRPAWLIRLGLWLYDHLARRAWLQGCETLDLLRHPAGAALQPRWQLAFAYSDGWVDDARLVVLNAVDAARRGAAILTGTRCERLQRHAGHWLATLCDGQGRARTVRARAVVNAAGPWAEALLRERAGLAPRRRLRLVRGSHIVVPRVPGHTHAYLLQASDRRVLFAIPYEQRYTLIGTTDVEHTGEPGAATIDEAETDYLCREASRYLRRAVRPTDVVWHYSGVRPLLDDGAAASAVTRDYRLELQTRGGAPLLTVWGGKITTYRTLARQAAQTLLPALGLPSGADWTRQSPLPGGDFDAVLGASPTPTQARQRFAAHLRQRWPWVAPALAQRWARSYGTLTLGWLQPAWAAADLGAEVAPGLFEAELEHLVRHEWARTADDVLWRRSKLGLHLEAAQQAAVADWLARHASRS